MGFRVWSEGEHIAVGLGVIRLHQRGSVETVDIGPGVVGVIGGDVLDDFLGGTIDFDLVRGARDMALPGHVHNGVQDHLAVNVGGKESTIFEEGGDGLGNRLVQNLVSKYCFDYAFDDSQATAGVSVCSRPTSA